MSDEATYLGARASARYVAAGARAEASPPSTNAGIEAEATTHGRTIHAGPAPETIRKVLAAVPAAAARARTPSGGTARSIAASRRDHRRATAISRINFGN